MKDNVWVQTAEAILIIAILLPIVVVLYPIYWLKEKVFG